MSGEIKEVQAGSNLEYEFKASAGVKDEKQLTVRSQDEKVAKVAKVEKTGTNMFKLTINGVREGTTGIIITAVPDKDTSFYQYINVKVIPAPEEKPVITTATVNNATYDLDGDAAVLTSAKDAKGKFSIPAKVKIGEKEYPVKKIAANAFKGSKITKLTIPAGVTEIGNSAVMNCKSLTSITFGKDVTTIGKKACYGCGKLKTIIFKGKKVKRIGAKAFKKCKKGATYKMPKKAKKALSKLLKGKVDKGYKTK